MERYDYEAPFEEQAVYAIGCVLTGAAALCLIPFTRRALARQVKPYLDRIGEAGAAEIAATAGQAAAKAAAAEGARRFFGV
jgi:hypothetical protein